MTTNRINVVLPKGEKATSLAICSPPGSLKVKPPVKVLQLWLALLTLKATPAAMTTSRSPVLAPNAIR